MRRTFAPALALLLLALAAGSAPAFAQAPKPGVEGYHVEWMYRVKYGHIDEWWDLFRELEVPVLERAKKLGYVLDYRIWRPTQHMDEAARWDYRVEITYKDYASSQRMGEVTAAVFPDDAARKKLDQRRWEMTANHWDLPIYPVDPTRPR